MIDWNIQSRSHCCQACQKPFADKEPFHTLLFDQKHAYERLDVCEPCWKNQFSQGATDRKGFISHWQSVYAMPPAAPPDPIQKDTAESLLRKLVEQNDPSHAAARFILAAMLERKRLFKVKAQVFEDGQRIFIYEHAQSGDLFNIGDPKLRLDQLEQVQQDVARLLEHGVPPSTDAAAASSSSSSVVEEQTSPPVPLSAPASQSDDTAPLGQPFPA